MLSEQAAKSLKFGDVVVFPADNMPETHPKYSGTGTVEVPVFGWFIDSSISNYVFVMLNVDKYGCREITNDFVKKYSLQGISQKDLIPYLGMNCGWKTTNNIIVSIALVAIVPAATPIADKRCQKQGNNISSDGEWISNIKKFRGENPPGSPFRWL